MQLSDDRTSQCVLETIFSPSFHLPKDGSSGVPGKGNTHLLNFTCLLVTVQFETADICECMFIQSKVWILYKFFCK